MTVRAKQQQIYIYSIFIFILNINNTSDGSGFQEFPNYTQRGISKWLRFLWTRREIRFETCSSTQCALARATHNTNIALMLGGLCNILMAKIQKEKQQRRKPTKNGHACNLLRVSVAFRNECVSVENICHFI